jgi:hypothetical protein
MERSAPLCSGGLADDPMALGATTDETMDSTKCTHQALGAASGGRPGDIPLVERSAPLGPGGRAVDPMDIAEDDEEDDGK